MGFYVSLGESKQLFGGEGGPEITGLKHGRQLEGLTRDQATLKGFRV